MKVSPRPLAIAAVFLGMAAAAAAQMAVPKPGAAPSDPFAAIPSARPDDVSSVDSIVAALYDAISGDAGVKRDWNRFRSLFHPGARMVPTGKNAASGKIAARMLTPEDYIERTGPLLERDGFHEQELASSVHRFGHIAQIFSSYEARHKLSDEKPFLRGINSFQLFNDGNRWWVTSITWSQETPEHPLPAEFARKSKR